MKELSPHLQRVGEIQRAITATRNDFVGKYRRKQMGSKVLTYEPELDVSVYTTLKKYQQDHEENAYIHVRNELNAYTQFQVETFIGERLNVGLSSFRYDLQNGQLYGQGTNEPLLDMIQRGRDCRDGLVKEVDRPRQDAEIEQFTKIQNVLGDPSTQVGTTVVSISPPGGEGSAYAHNFYDVFVLSEDSATRERFVAAHRYASELSLEEYKAKAEELVPGYFAQYADQPLDSYFLSHPVVINEKSPLSSNPDKIHANFHKGKDFLSQEKFDDVKLAVAGLIVSYVNTLVATPDEIDLLHLHLNAIMNKADDAAGLGRRGKQHDAVVVSSMKTLPVSYSSELEFFGRQQVRAAATGCGESAGFGKEDRTASNMSLFSSGDYGKDSYGSRTFNCPECGEQNLRPVNELLSNCQQCGSEKVAC